MWLMTSSRVIPGPPADGWNKWLTAHDSYPPSQTNTANEQMVHRQNWVSTLLRWGLLTVWVLLSACPASSWQSPCSWWRCCCPPSPPRSFFSTPSGSWAPPASPSSASDPSDLKEDTDDNQIHAEFTATVLHICSLLITNNPHDVMSAWALTFLTALHSGGSGWRDSLSEC